MITEIDVLSELYQTCSHASQAWFECNGPRPNGSTSLHLMLQDGGVKVTHSLIEHGAEVTA